MTRRNGKGGPPKPARPGDDAPRGEAALNALRADIKEGLDDIAAGRVSNFDADGIVEEGKRRLARRA
jgi:hypothetical protein